MNTHSRHFATHNDIPHQARTEIVALLNQELADSTDLHSQVKFAHWNVKGQQFMQLHLLFDEIAAIVIDQVDMIAERATALGGTALGTVRLAAANSQLAEFPPTLETSEEYVAVLAERMGQHGAYIRAAIDKAIELGDQDTGDLFIEISRALDKYLWFLEAHIQKEIAQ
ncbi:MAG: DNA starvation/stationary phase protection protein Dps [Caldilineaceae bacterium]